MKRVLFIINPKSGRTKAKSHFFDMVNAMSMNDCIVTTRITTKSGEATDFAFQGCESGNYDRIVCCGGDGTLNETVSGILQSERRLPLGYIPTGSTNDYAKTLGINSNAVEAAKIAVTGKEYPIDIGCMDGTFFNYVASFGAFTAVSYSASQSLKNMFGHLAYILEGIKDLTKIKAIPVTIKTEALTYEGRYIFGAIANSTSLGGIVKLDETLVSLNDGVFEVCLVKEPKNAADMLKIIKGAMSSDFSSDCFEFFRASNMEITVPDELAWSLDGEKHISGQDVKIDIIHSALSVII